VPTLFPPQVIRGPLGGRNEIEEKMLRQYIVLFLICIPPIILLTGCASTQQINKSTAIVQSAHNLDLNGMAAVMGCVIDANTLDPFPFADVVNEDSLKGHISTSTDSCGNYQIIGVSPGTYVFSAHFLGYRKAYSLKIRLNPNQLIILDFRLVEEPQLSSPISLRPPNQSLKLTEIAVDDLTRAKQPATIGHDLSRADWIPSLRHFVAAA